LFWAPVFPLIQILVARYPLERETLPVNGLRHAAAAILIASFHLGALLWFMHIIGHGYGPGHSFLVHFQQAILFRGWGHLFAYLVLLCIALVSDYYGKYRERRLLASQLQAQLSQAKLQALRMQLNPHFLFNALNSIAMLARRNDNTRAVRMIAGLGDLLRHVLEDSPEDEVTVRDEVRFIERYLEIERVRFGERLDVQIDVQESALDAFVPNLLLQPLVENAIKHGIARKPTGGTITITGARVGDRIVLEIADDGPGMSAGPREGTGVGLVNIRQRLQQLYGDQFAFDVENVSGGGVRATIWLPHRAAPRMAVAANLAS
jgi:signal transduction histidine kinase